MPETPRRHWSLHITISMLLVGILILVVGGAVAITLVVRGKSLKATAATIQHEVSKGLAEKLMERLSPAEGILEAAAAGILEGGIATDDSRALARLLAERVRYDDRFEVIAFRTPDGGASGALRGLDGSVRLLRSAVSIPRVNSLLLVFTQLFETWSTIVGQLRGDGFHLITGVDFCLVILLILTRCGRTEQKSKRDHDDQAATEQEQRSDSIENSIATSDCFTLAGHQCLRPTQKNRSIQIAQRSMRHLEDFAASSRAYIGEGWLPRKTPNS